MSSFSNAANFNAPPLNLMTVMRRRRRSDGEKERWSDGDGEEMTTRKKWSYDEKEKEQL